jgi:2-polyprenyl-6-methoxyphenol hydroxylase-like FAD-dependent oxidoreductase
LHSAAHQIIERHLPDVKEAMVQAGCVTIDPTELMPPRITDRARREGDERFVTLTGRRIAIEYAFATAASKVIPVIRGVSGAGLSTGSQVVDGVPHVTGVRTTDGEEILADLVIDAMGRRSNLPNWLRAVGAKGPFEEAEEYTFMYYTQFFRSASGALPAFRAGLQTHFHSFSLLTLPCDSGTWSVTAVASSGDSVMKALRDPQCWAAVLNKCPLHAHWLDGEPISGVHAMAGIADRYRRYVVDGAPVATGIVSVGDASVCTNPIGGRGITMGLMHALGTVEVINQHLSEPHVLALAHDSMTEAKVMPWYRFTAESSRARNAQIKAAIQGQDALKSLGPSDALAAAMAFDADLYRAFLEVVSLLSLPEDVMARPGIRERVLEVAPTHQAPEPPGPSRAELVRMLA